jgi:hypothetical protein
MSAFDTQFPVPICLIHLVSSLHKYGPGHIENASKLSFSTSFKSSGMHHDETASLLRDLDSSRVELATALAGDDCTAILGQCERYLPRIRRLLLSCEVQPEGARLNEHLNFRWQGGLEGDGTGGLLGKTRESQALM